MRDPGRVCWNQTILEAKTLGFSQWNSDDWSLYGSGLRFVLESSFESDSSISHGDRYPAVTSVFPQSFRSVTVTSPPLPEISHVHACLLWPESPGWKRPSPICTQFIRMFSPYCTSNTTLGEDQWTGIPIVSQLCQLVSSVKSTLLTLSFQSTQLELAGQTSYIRLLSALLG